MTDDTENTTYALARMVVIVIRDNALLYKFITYNCIIICKKCPSKIGLQLVCIYVNMEIPLGESKQFSSEVHL